MNAVHHKRDDRSSVHSACQRSACGCPATWSADWARRPLAALSPEELAELERALLGVLGIGFG
jgi:hypothetical protein